MDDELTDGEFYTLEDFGKHKGCLKLNGYALETCKALIDIVKTQERWLTFLVLWNGALTIWTVFRMIKP